MADQVNFGVAESGTPPPPVPPNTLLIVGGIGTALVIAGIAIASSRPKKTDKKQ